MTVPEIMRERMAFSFEVFPPKDDKPIDGLLRVLKRLYDFNPDYISCTYGAGGSTVGKNIEICRAIQDSGQCRAVTHFTCMGHTRDNVKKELDNYLNMGVDHLLVLLGDFPEGWTDTRGDFNHASELISYIRKLYGSRFTIAMGAAPEKHISAPSFKSDIAHLKHKADCGADYIITQLCFDIDNYKRWVDMIRGAGINLPIDVGIMPVLDKDATIRMALSMNGCSIPRQLAEIISRYYKDPEGFKKAGKEFTVELLYDYINAGIDGLHLYALNKSNDISEILEMSGISGSGIKTNNNY
ncbi:MAG: methylenetetrahydrofolate reductase [Oscillospiraceae bacterium]|nr:methylenetetrahydrofolate reductase [Oscillospiraceae bacterium]